MEAPADARANGDYVFCGNKVGYVIGLILNTLVIVCPAGIENGFGYAFSCSVMNSPS